MTWSFLHEVGRKIIHLMILLVLIVYYILEQTYNKQAALLSLVALLMVFIILEYFRLELNWKMPFFSTFIRPKEQNRMCGAIFFLSATIICLAVFDFKIALAALLMTTFGDMTAAIVGKKYGQSLIYRNKTLVGCVTELIVNLIVGFTILALTNIYATTAMAFTATVVETLVDELDDNLIVPIFSAFVGQILLFLI